MREILQSVKTIAIVGASDKTHRASYGVMQFLQEKGFRCVPVSPRLAGKTLQGVMVHENLAAIPEPVDMVDLFVNSELAGPLVDEAIEIGAKVVKYEGVETVGGEECHKIFIDYGQGGQMSTWLFAKSDYLPRRRVQHFRMADPGDEATEAQFRHELTGLFGHAKQVIHHLLRLAGEPVDSASR